MGRSFPLWRMRMINGTERKQYWLRPASCGLWRLDRMNVLRLVVREGRRQRFRLCTFQVFFRFTALFATGCWDFWPIFLRRMFLEVVFFRSILFRATVLVLIVLASLATAARGAGQTSLRRL